MTIGTIFRDAERERCADGGRLRGRRRWEDEDVAVALLPAVPCELPRGLVRGESSLSAGFSLRVFCFELFDREPCGTLISSSLNIAAVLLSESKMASVGGGGGGGGTPASAGDPTVACTVPRGKGSTDPAPETRDAPTNGIGDKPSSVPSGFTPRFGTNGSRPPMPGKAMPARGKAGTPALIEPEEPGGKGTMSGGAMLAIAGNGGNDANDVGSGKGSSDGGGRTGMAELPAVDTGSVLMKELLDAVELLVYTD